MINFDGINISYKQKELLSNARLKLLKGNLYTFIGLNGSGKTSLLRYLKYKNGHHINIRMLQQNQNIESAFGISLWDFLKSFCLFERIYEWEKLLVHYLHVFDLYTKKSQLICSLSGGERQKMFLVQILLGKSDLILLDESFANIDIKHKIVYYDLLAKEAEIRNIPIILIEHDIRFALEHSDNVIFCNTMEHSLRVFPSGSVELLKMINQDFEIDISLDNKYILL